MRDNLIHIIFIPGLGDRYDPLRKWLLGLWRYRDVSVEHVPMRWSDDEPYEAKIMRLEAAIDAARSKKIVLVGESAGGSIAVALYPKRSADLHRVVTVCGKNKGADTVSPYLYAQNPAFKQSMRMAEAAGSILTDEQRGRFVSIHPIYDPTVPINETILQGCREVTLWSIGHLLPIIQVLSLWSWRVIRIAREE